MSRQSFGVLMILELDAINCSHPVSAAVLLFMASNSKTMGIEKCRHLLIVA